LFRSRAIAGRVAAGIGALGCRLGIVIASLCCLGCSAMWLPAVVAFCPGAGTALSIAPAAATLAATATLALIVLRFAVLAAIFPGSIAVHALWAGFVHQSGPARAVCAAPGRRVACG